MRSGLVKNCLGKKVLQRAVSSIAKNWAVSHYRGKGSMLKKGKRKWGLKVDNVKGRRDNNLYLIRLQPREKTPLQGGRKSGECRSERNKP